MKEELIQLRDLTNDYSEAKKEFEARRDTFNEDVKEVMVILAKTVVAARYETAVEFYDEYQALRDFARQLKKEHPRYGEKRVEETLEAWFKTVPEYQDRTLCVDQIVDAYLVFERCGFDEVRALEQHSKELAVKLAENVEGVKTDKIDTAIQSVNDAIEAAKPYGEAAKKHLTAFGNFAKGAISKGAKQLIKILDETDSKKDE